ncbi:MAG: hypothetical protein JF597_50360 [Streptomyces sp.]|uniref:hypothetical protein n=1 Tax=Streptomyces sp. TaxID=1931 RepID=UPI0025FC5E68|nr:hypothetical protein [Streptomyces sp.]MBW8801461.1 hypothetical protein [Streptomyces sp.]
MPRIALWSEVQAAEVAACVTAQKKAALRAAELGLQADQRRRDLQSRRSQAAALPPLRGRGVPSQQQASVVPDRELQPAE